jgi:hypothetical protein
MEIERGLTKTLGAGSCEAFGEIYDKVAYIAFNAIIHLKFGNDVSTCDYENFLIPRIDQHMMNFLDLVTEKASGNNIPINYWVNENILDLLKD